MAWTPRIGAASLASRLGRSGAVDVLVRLLAGGVAGPELVLPRYRRVLLDIGDGHAERLLSDDTGRRLAYWPRVWAARALSYVGTHEAGPGLRRALEDEHWRVRMTVVQAIGRLDIPGSTQQLLNRLDDEHPRVRSAALLALERVGTEAALPRLAQPVAGVGRGRTDRAVARIIARATG